MLSNKYSLRWDYSKRKEQQQIEYPCSSVLWRLSVNYYPKLLPRFFYIFIIFPIRYFLNTLILHGIPYGLAVSIPLSAVRQLT